MSAHGRWALLITAGLPMPIVYILASNAMLPGGGVGLALSLLASILVAATATVSVVGGWRREALPQGANDSSSRPDPVGEGMAFEFSQQSPISAAAILLLIVPASAVLVLRHGTPYLVFAALTSLLFAAAFGLIIWRGRYHLDIYDDRIRVQEAFWRSSQDSDSAAEIPTEAITRVVVERGWGNWGFAPVIGIYADELGEADGACIPLGTSDRQEGQRCLSRLLEVVPEGVVDEGVLHLKSALDSLEAATGRPSDAALADRALRLIGRDKLEEAGALLDSTSASADLHRARAELAEVVRSANA
jgi:hypothetical protein